MADEFTWETDFQKQARLQFVSAWKDKISNERLESLSMVWVNMKYWGCRYPLPVEQLVSDLESKACIPEDLLKREYSKKVEFLASTLKKPEPAGVYIENFVIYEPNCEGDVSNPVAILNESAQKSKKSLSFVENTEKGSDTFSFGVFIQDNLIAHAQAQSKKEAKRKAAEKALEALKSTQPVVEKRKINHNAATTVSKTELTNQAYVNAPSIPDSNLGNMMLRKMGWSGVGGVGKDGQGRAEPVMVTGADGKKGLGQDNTGNQLNRQSIKQRLTEFIRGPDMDLRFPADLAKEERALIHKLSGELGLRHLSYRKGKDRYLMVSKVNYIAMKETQRPKQVMEAVFNKETQFGQEFSYQGFNQTAIDTNNFIPQRNEAQRHQEDDIHVQDEYSYSQQFVQPLVKKRKIDYDAGNNIVTGDNGKQRLGQEVTGKELDKASIEQRLRDFISGPEMDLKFPAGLDKEKRALIHNISDELGLEHQSYGNGPYKYLMVRKCNSFTGQKIQTVYQVPVIVIGTNGRNGFQQEIRCSELNNRASIESLLRDFIKGPNIDLQFPSDLAKEQRALIHNISGEFGLRHHSFGEGHGRYLLVRKHY